MRGILFLIAVLTSVTHITACTSGSSDSVTPKQALPPIGSQPIANTPEAADGLLEDIKEKVNSDPRYVLQEEDVKTLVSEGLIEESEIQAWVK